MFSSNEISKVVTDAPCDICGERNACYYSLTWYVHFCSEKCFKRFIEGYNREIDEISRKGLAPDDM